MNKIKKQLLALFGVIAGLTIITPFLTTDTQVASYLQGSYFAILLAISMWLISQKENAEIAININEMKKQLDRIENKISNTAQQTQPTLSADDMKNIIKEWEVVIKTQMHFNDLLMKIRTATISFVVGVFSAATYILQYDIPLRILGAKVHASTTIIIAGVAFLIIMFFVDYFYYYKMLLGAVKRGYKFDQEFQNVTGHKYFGISTDISETISKKKGASKYYVIAFYWVMIAVGFFILFAIITGYAFWS